MCGIGGIMMYNSNRTEAQLEFIRELASGLAIENQVRGNHATGIATFNKFGKHGVLKHNVSAEELTAYDAWQEYLEKNINNNTTNILIHTRFATKGEPEKNDNNHPIETATSIGIHNGMIYNDDSLFAKEKLFRQAEVDSEVIFRLVDKETGNEMENTKNVAEKISGVFAVAFVKKEEPTKLNYFRNNNPTTFAYIPELNITVFASMRDFIVRAIESANLVCYYSKGFSLSNNDSLSWFNPKEDIIMQFDVEENTPLQQLYQEQMGFVDNENGWFGYYGSYGGWSDDDFQEDWHHSRKGATKQVEPEPDKFDNVYDFIDRKNLEHLMSDEDYITLLELLDQSEKLEWARGYKAGRESFDEERALLREELDIANLRNRQQKAN
jgi:predicted glutamine amidotransferase